MATLTDFKEWVKATAGTLYFDPGDNAPAGTIGQREYSYVTVPEDIRFAKDKNGVITPDAPKPPQYLLWFDGQVVRVCAGVRKLKRDEDMDEWTFEDLQGKPWRVGRWYSPKQRDRDTRWYQKFRDPFHTQLMDRYQYLLEGKDPDAAAAIPPNQWNKYSEDLP